MKLDPTYVALSPSDEVQIKFTGTRRQRTIVRRVCDRRNISMNKLFRDFIASLEAEGFAIDADAQ